MEGLDHCHYVLSINAVVHLNNYGPVFHRHIAIEVKKIFLFHLDAAPRKKILAKGFEATSTFPCIIDPFENIWTPVGIFDPQNRETNAVDFLAGFCAGFVGDFTNSWSCNPLSGSDGFALSVNFVLLTMFVPMD